MDIAEILKAQNERVNALEARFDSELSDLKKQKQFRPKKEDQASSVAALQKELEVKIAELDQRMADFDQQSKAALANFENEAKARTERALTALSVLSRGAK